MSEHEYEFDYDEKARFCGVDDTMLEICWHGAIGDREYYMMMFDKNTEYVQKFRDSDNLREFAQWLLVLADEFDKFMASKQD